MSKDIYVLIEHNQDQISEISYVMLAAGRQLAILCESQLVAIYLGDQTKNIPMDIFADKLLYIEHPLLKEFTQDAYLQILNEIIKDKQPKIVLIGNTSIGSDLAGDLSINLNLDLISSCKEFTAEGNIICQICGGKIMAELDFPSNPTLITMLPGGYKPEEGRSKNQPPFEVMNPPDFNNMKIKINNIILPDNSDIDISNEPILVSVGRGIQTQDNIELAENLSKALGGVVCASRPIIDQGWLPSTRLVGKSGKHVKPKIYIAIGISGAPEHIEAITNSETIIAINTDPKAPIFDIATFGTEMDLFDLLEVLVEKVERHKLNLPI